LVTRWGHLRRAALLHSELMSLRKQQVVLTGHLDRYPQAFVLIDTECRLVFANSAARHLGAREDGIRLENTQFQITSPQGNREFRQAAKELLGDVHSDTRRLEIPRSGGPKIQWQAAS
jgi:hypothetical protein